MSGCSCQPLPNGEPPAEPDIDCPIHGAEPEPEGPPAPDPDSLYDRDR